MKKFEVEKARKIKRTITFNFRGDIRDVATLVHIYEDLLDTPIHAKSTVIRLALHDFADILSKQMEKAHKFESTEEAYRFLLQRQLMDSSEHLLSKSRVDKIAGEDRDFVSEMVIPESVERMAEEAQKELDELNKKGN